MANDWLLAAGCMLRIRTHKYLLTGCCLCEEVIKGCKHTLRKKERKAVTMEKRR